MLALIENVTKAERDRSAFVVGGIIFYGAGGLSVFYLVVKGSCLVESLFFFLLTSWSVCYDETDIESSTMSRSSIARTDALCCCDRRGIGTVAYGI